MKKQNIAIISAVTGAAAALAAGAYFLMKKRNTYEGEALDMDGDGVAESVGIDTVGDGEIDTILVDTDGNGVIDTILEDTDGDGVMDTAHVDIDEDGKTDVVLGASPDATEAELLAAAADVRNNGK